MKKLGLLVIVVLIANESISQKRLLDATIVFKNNDTLRTAMRAYVNMFNKDLINPLNFVYNKIVTYQGSGKKRIINTRDVDVLSFTDFNKNDRLFVSQKYTRPINVRPFLVEVLERGEIDWYCEYYPHGYDRSVQRLDILVKAEGQTLSLALLKNNKKALKEFMAGRTDVHPLIDEFYLGNNEKLREIVVKYNSQ